MFGDKILSLFRQRDNEDIRSQMLNFVLVGSLLGSLAGLLASFLAGASLICIAFISMIMVLVAFLFVIMRRYHRTTLVSVILGVCVNLIIFPGIYFTGGGIYSSINTWFELGFLFCFLLFSGKVFWIMMAASFASFTGCYVISYQHPEWVTKLSLELNVYQDTYVGLIAASLIVGCLFKFQMALYEKEKKNNQRQQRELEEANQIKNRFLANISHEIRTPMNTILGLNEMNLREKVPPEVEDNCLNIQRAGKILLALINDVLDLSRIEAGKMELIRQKYDVGAMLSDLVNIHWVKAHEKKLEFLLDISPSIPSVLYGDDIRVRQIISNILGNAIKYTEKGSVTLQVDSRKKEGNRVQLMISVSDTGIGIRKKDIPHLFDAFQRVDEKKIRSIEGSGLGLAISKNLVDMMGGELRVDSVFQRGSTFTVSLEQEIVDARPLGELSERRMDSDKRIVYHQSFEAPGAKVLVVDDSQMNLLVVTKLLRDTKVQVDTAGSGAQCLALTRKNYYHVIFMDHMMPQMDGRETLQRLREQENGLCRNVPVIVLTANVFSGAGEFYRKMGFQGYLVKPVSGLLLEQTLLKFLPEELAEKRLWEEEVLWDNAQFQMIHGKKKKYVCVTTDSICDLPEEMMKECGIRHTYYYVNTEKGRFRDGPEIASENLVDHLKNEKAEARSQSPSVEEYEDFFARCLEDAERIIHISVGRGVGNGYQNALQAAEGFDNVYVVDSEQLSSGMGILAWCGAKLARRELPVQEILAELEEIKKRISTSFILPSVEEMYRAGRVSRTVKSLCTVFGLRPVLCMKNGEIVCRRMYGGSWEQAMRRYVHRCVKGKRGIDKEIFFLTHAGCSYSVMEEIKKEVEKYQTFDRFIVQQASAAISSNCGLGTFGLIFLNLKKGD